MSHRSSESEKHKTKQRRDVLTPERQLKLRGEKGEALPPITRPRNSSTSMTGKIGMPSSPRHPVAALPPNYSVSKSDKSKEGWRTPSRRVTPGECHIASHNQWLEDTRHYSVKRSGSYDPKTTGSKHRRSSSISGMSSPVQEPDRPPPASEKRHFKTNPAESRYGGWTGGGSDVIAHRDPSNPIVSYKKESTYKESESHGALAQSALNSYTASQFPLVQQETPSSSNSHAKTTQRFDASPAWSRRYDTERRTSHLCNDNNNSNAGGSPPHIPHSFSNGENPQSYPLSTTTYQGLSGGGGRHSKYKQYTANGSVGNGIQSDSLYSPGGSRGSSRTLTPHKVRVCIVYFTVSLKCMLVSLSTHIFSEVQYTHNAHNNTTNLTKLLMCTYLHVRMHLVSFPSLPSSPPPLPTSPLPPPPLPSSLPPLPTLPLLFLESPVVEVVSVVSETLATL